MSITRGDLEDHINGLLHGADTDDLDDFPLILQRASNTLLSRISPVDTMRTAALPQAVFDDIYNYTLPSDYKGIIDLYPQDNRQSYDKAVDSYAGPFDLRKALTQKTVSIEGSEGTKYARINWRSRQGKVLNSMNSVTGNGTWSAVGTATGVATDSIFKVAGSGSVRFTHVATGNGIQNTTMTPVDLTAENGVSSVFVWVYFSNVPTSVTAIWGNDLTTNFWTGLAQTTQFDGSAFKVGWNLLGWSWAAATQTGTVLPATIDSFKITLAGSALGITRVDNIIFAIGRNFDMKYYSKYLMKNSSGTWIGKSTSASDTIVLDDDAIQILILETLIGCAQQTQEGDSGSDVTWAEGELHGRALGNGRRNGGGLYDQYKKRYSSQEKKPVTSVGNPKPSRGRW